MQVTPVHLDAAAAAVHAGMTVTVAAVFQLYLCIVVSMSTQPQKV